MCNLTEEDKKNLLKDFPKQRKLSYKNHYKKVLNYDIVFAIPEGRNAFIWFTHFNGKDVCIVLEVNINHQIENMYVQNVCFNYELCFGTVLYGTLFKCNGYSYFSLEDMFSYKGKNIYNLKLIDKLNLYTDFFKFDLSLNIYNKSFLLIALPIISYKEDELLKKINSLPYKVRYIEYRFFSDNNNYPILYLEYTFLKYDPKKQMHSHLKKESNIYSNPNENQCYLSNKKKVIVFLIKPDIQNDIYHLYSDNGTSYHSIAYIPDYKTSVKMNKLFRNIKENENLDTLEESDDEEEFQNEKLDKFVYLDKSYKMVCNYSYKFKKWVPEKIADENFKIVCRKDLEYMEKNKY